MPERSVDVEILSVINRAGLPRESAEVTVDGGGSGITAVCCGSREDVVWVGRQDGLVERAVGTGGLRPVTHVPDPVSVLAEIGGSLVVGQTSGDMRVLGPGESGAAAGATRLSGHTARICAVGSDSSVTTLLTMSTDGRVLRWDASAAGWHGPIVVRAAEEALAAGAIGADGRTVLIAPIGEQPSILDVATARAVPVPVEEPVLAAAAVPDGSGFVLATLRNDLVRVWNDGRTVTSSATAPRPSCPTSVRVTHDSRLVIVCSADYTARVWDLWSLEPVGLLPATVCSSGALDVSARGIATYGHVRGALGRVGLDQMHETCGTRHEASIWSIAASPGAAMFASGSSDGSVKLWDVEAGVVVRTLAGHDGGVTSVCFGPGSRGVVSTGYDGQVLRWDHSGRSTVIGRHDSRAWMVSALRTTDVVASIGADRYLRVWEGESSPTAPLLEVPLEAVGTACHLAPRGGSSEWVLVYGERDGHLTTLNLRVTSAGRRGRLVGVS